MSVGTRYAVTLPPDMLCVNLQALHSLHKGPTVAVHSIGLGGLCPKKALLCYAVMPAGSSIMLNLEAYYARNMPTVCL